MARKDPVGEHSEDGFVNSFKRYVVLGLVVESSSWEEFSDKLSSMNKSIFFNKSIESTNYFKEYKFFNIVILVEQALSRYIELTQKAGEIKNEAALYEFVRGKIQQYRDLTKEEVQELLDQEIGSKDSSLLSPHLLFRVAGITLGGLIHMVRTYLAKTPVNEELVCCLTAFNNYRNEIFHQAVSSRVSIISLVDNGLIAGAKILDNLQSLRSERSDWKLTIV